MRISRPDLLRIGVGLTTALTLAAGSLAAQAREVLSSQIAVSSRDATLRLEFAEGDRLEIALRGGAVLVDGEEVGEYSSGDALEASWRALLGEVVSLDDGPLARALVDWEPPEELTGDAARLAGRLDDVLEGRISGPAAPEPDRDAGAEVSGDVGRSESVAALLRRADRLPALAEALEGLTLRDVRIRAGEDVTVEEETRLAATLVVLDGDVEIRGEVRGDVVVVDGSVRVYESGRITGNVRLVDARIFREGGTIEGTVESVPVDGELYGTDVDGLRDRIRREVRPDVDELRDRIREEVREELRSEIRRDDRGSSVFAPLRSVGRGIAGLLQNLISFAIVALIGVGVVHFFPENLEAVSEAARENPGRAAMVGMAGSFLLIPVWILGMVALAVSIVGIPVLLAWIPLFPVAACAAAGFGYLAAARLVGEWVARQGFRNLDFLRSSNAVHGVVAGLAVLLVPFAAANVVEMGGHWLGFLEGLLVAAGWVAAVTAVAIGFGAVLLTRGGRRPAWSGGPDPFDLEPDWDRETAGEQEWSDLERSSRRRPRSGADRGPGASGGGGEERPGAREAPGTEGGAGESGAERDSSPEEKTDG